MLIDLYLQGRLPLEKFVTETITLDAVEEALEAWSYCSFR
jgi:S-(hydroxymethyl)mycothiol dehydrogenase